MPRPYKYIMRDIGYEYHIGYQTCGTGKPVPLHIVYHRDTEVAPARLQPAGG